MKSASSENGQLAAAAAAAAAASAGASAGASAVPASAALVALCAALFLTTLGVASAPPSSPSDEELEHGPKRRAWPCPAPPPEPGSLGDCALAWADIALLLHPAASYRWSTGSGGEREGEGG